MTTKYRTPAQALLTGFKALIATLWAATAATAYAAAAAAHDAGLDGFVLDWRVLVAITCLLSSLSGGTALAWRINDLMLKEDARVATEGGERRPFVRPLLFAAAHMGGSWVGGTLAFLLGKANGWDVWTTLIGVVAMSFMGSKGVEAFAERWLGSVKMPGTPAGGAT